MNVGENYYCSKCMKKIEEEMICPYCGHDPDSLAARSSLEEGTLLQKGRYQLGAVLGTGGFGITYAAWDYTLAQPVAIKEYFPRSFTARDIREGDGVFVMEEHRTAYEIGLRRFNREARILSTLQNVKSVVTVHDWFEANGTAYIVMEYVRGKTLEQYAGEERVSPAELIAMLRDLVDSLISIHAQGVLHRDISPGNLMVQEDRTVKLIDFGAAATEERLAEGKDHTVIFSRAFAPVEQYDENGLQGPWTDIYALSATLYYLITGELPLEALARKGHDSLKSIRSRKIRLKRYQEKAILDGMAVSPQKRIQSMEIFRSVLYHLPMPEEIRRRRKFMAKAISAAIVIASAGLLVGINVSWGLPGPLGLRFGIRPDGLHVTGFHGTQSVLVIPSSVMGLPVTAIDPGSFGWDSELTEVTIPGSVKSVNPRAFSGCGSLLAVTIEEGNQTIDEYAFADCPSLRTVILPASTRRVAASAFSDSASALTVWCEDESIPKVTMTGTGIHTAAISDYETIQNHTGVSITGYHGIVSQYESANTLTIPDYIGNQPVTAFEAFPSNTFSVDLVNIRMPEKLEVLPSGVVSSMLFLEEVMLGTELKEIGDYALFGTGIKELQLPDTLESIGEYAFSLSHLEHITVPASVTRIEDGAFSNCSKLTSIVLSGQIKTIPSRMFDSCISLTDVELPENLESIGQFSFANCSSLRALRLPSALETIDEYAFSECENLQIIYIPPNTTSIDSRAFDGCPSSMVIAGISKSMAQSYAERYGFLFLAADQWDFSSSGVVEGGLVIIDAEEEDYTELPSVYAGDEDENECCVVERVSTVRPLKSRRVTLPKYATVVGGFTMNSYLTEVYTGVNLQEIEAMAFFECPNLHSFHLVNGLRKIGDCAFAKDGRLASIQLPETLEQIGLNAFWRCENLTSINIPESLTLLEDGCLSETGLTSVIIPGNIVKCSSAFYGCQNLQAAVLEEGVKTVWGTFSQCPALESVIFPSTIQEISRSTFHGCTSLKDVWIYSADADLDFVCPRLKHINEVMEFNGSLLFSDISMESDKETTPLLFADCPDVTIHGYAGSTAETYAKEHKIAFEVIN